MPLLYDRISVKNFKSIKDVTLDLGKLNVLVGPNGSGKSNLLEAFLFARSVVRPASFPPYPFAPWWGYQNIVFGQDTKNNVEFRVEGKTGKGVPFSYSFVLNGAGDNVNLLDEDLRVGDELNFQRRGSLISIENGKVSQAQMQARPGINDRYAINLKDNRYSIFSLMMALSTEKYGAYEDRYLALRPDLVEAAAPVILAGRPENLSAFDEVFQSFFKDVLYLSYESSLAKAPIPPLTGVGTHGEGIASSLFSRYGVSIPGGYLNDFLKEYGLSISYNLWHGQAVSLKLVEQGLQLDVPGIPDGYLKMITILHMLDMRPSLLLIDELENSLHLKLIELAISAFRSFEGKVVVTTHSPMVVDLVDPSELILLEKSSKENEVPSTVAMRVTDPEKIKQRLARDGLALSESWLYGDLEENLG